MVGGCRSKVYQARPPQLLRGQRHSLGRNVRDAFIAMRNDWFGSLDAPVSDNCTRLNRLL